MIRATILTLLVFAAALAASADDSPTRLGVGDSVPALSLVDIEEDETSIAEYDGHVLVLSFGDRDSSEEMKEWMGDAQLAVMKAHPEIPVAYIAFADVSAVPSWLQGMVRPLLASSNESAGEDLAESQRKAGIETDPTKQSFRFIPDWDGELLEAFGLEDATKYHAWIAVDGKVVATMHPGMPDPAKVYVDTFAGIAAQRATPSSPADPLEAGLSE